MLFLSLWAELKAPARVTPPAQQENYPPLGEIQSLHAMLGFSQWVSIRGKYPKVKSVTSVTLQSQNNITALTLCLFRCVVQETASFSDWKNDDEHIYCLSDIKKINW